MEKTTEHLWQSENQKAMAALTDGDLKSAAKHWTSCVTEIEKGKIPASVEVGEVYYHLGKTLAELGKDLDAFPYFKTGLEMVEHVDPQNPMLASMQYGLGTLFGRLHMQGSSELFQQALGIDCDAFQGREFIPMKEALKVIRDVGLAEELKGKVLTDACKRGEWDASDTNEFIAGVLLSYYAGDQKKTHERTMKDGFFFSDYTQFDFVETLETLCSLADRPQLLEIIDWKGSTIEDENLVATLKLEDGRVLYHVSTSVVGLLDTFNTALDAMGIEKQFYSLECQGDLGEYFCAFLLTPAQFDELDQTGALFFDKDIEEQDDSDDSVDD